MKGTQIYECGKAFKYHGWWIEIVKWNNHDRPATYQWTMQRYNIQIRSRSDYISKDNAILKAKTWIDTELRR
jgi:hypothetical protein